MSLPLFTALLREARVKAQHDPDLGGNKHGYKTEHSQAKVAKRYGFATASPIKSLEEAADGFSNIRADSPIVLHVLRTPELYAPGIDPIELRQAYLEDVGLADLFIPWAAVRDALRPLHGTTGPRETARIMDQILHAVKFPR